MNKKTIISFALVGVICLGAGVGAGTRASYKKSFTSQQNIVRAAKFNIDVNNGEFKDSAMTLVGKDLKPGTNKEAYNFEINKDAEVDVEYQVALTQEGELLKAGTPVKIILQNLVDGKWQDVALNYKYQPKSNNEKFKIIINWPEETTGINDIDYAGKEGKIKISVTANQVMEKPFVPKVITVNKPLSVTWDMYSEMLYAGTDVNPKYNLTKDIKYSKNEKGLNVLDIGNINLIYNWNNSKEGKVDMQNVVFTQKESGSNKYIASCNGGNWNGNEFTITLKDWIRQPDLTNFRNITLANGECRVHFDASVEEISWFKN